MSIKVSIEELYVPVGKNFIFMAFGSNSFAEYEANAYGDLELSSITVEGQKIKNVYSRINSRDDAQITLSKDDALYQLLSPALTSGRFYDNAIEQAIDEGEIEKPRSDYEEHNTHFHAAHFG